MRQTPQPLQFPGKIFFQKIVIVTAASTIPGLSIDSTQADLKKGNAIQAGNIYKSTLCTNLTS